MPHACKDLHEGCLPGDRPWFEVAVRGRSRVLAIRAENPDRVCSGVAEMTVDGSAEPPGEVNFPTDGSVRAVVVRLGGERRQRGRVG